HLHPKYACTYSILSVKLLKRLRKGGGKRISQNCEAIPLYQSMTATVSSRVRTSAGRLSLKSENRLSSWGQTAISVLTSSGTLLLSHYLPCKDPGHDESLRPDNVRSSLESSPFSSE